MKDILIPLLLDAYNNLEKQVPQTKKEIKHISIEGVSPNEKVITAEMIHEIEEFIPFLKPKH